MPVSARLNSIAFWLFVATLAWAPFPLGSNRQWSTALLIGLIALCWLLWWSSIWDGAPIAKRYLKRLTIPLGLAIAALVWGLVQSVSWVPADWIHPLWPMAADALGKPVTGAISLNPWRTNFEVLKLATYLSSAWLACMFAAVPDRARQLLDAIIIITAAYSAYALGLWATGYMQFELFYATIPVGNFMSGPFVLHNSYATYAGLGALAAIIRLFDLGGKAVRTGRGFRPLFLSILQFGFGRGALPFLAFLLCFSTVIFSASRAGFASTVFGLLVMLLLSIPLAARRATIGWIGVAALATGAIVVALYLISGDTLNHRFDALVQAGGPDATRLLAWSSAERMITDSPWLGLGLGSFENAFPLYSDHVIPNVLDKAHCDYLELAAGWGLPAAFAWWGALLTLAGICIRGVFVRRRNRIYALYAVSATALVGLHSAFDFSLQMPAIALTYAAVLGLGVAQAFSTRRSTA